MAGSYAEFRPEYPHTLFEWISNTSKRRERAWDCATGNGQAAVLLKGFFNEVVATDASAGQIANARQADGLRYAVASAECSGLADASVDCVTVAQAAHWFDLPKFYKEAERVLRPGGLLVLWCYTTFQFEDERIDELVGQFYSEVVEPFWPPERRFVEERYRTLNFPLDEIPAPTFRMQAEFTLNRLGGYLRTWSATQGFMKAKGFDPVADLEAELARTWPENGQASLRPKQWPIYLRAGRFNDPE